MKMPPFLLARFLSWKRSSQCCVGRAVTSLEITRISIKSGLARSAYQPDLIAGVVNTAVPTIPANSQTAIAIKNLKKLLILIALFQDKREPWACAHE